MKTKIKRWLSLLLVPLLAVPFLTRSVSAGNLVHGESDKWIVTAFYAQSGEDMPRRQSDAKALLQNSIQDKDGKGVCMMFVEEDSATIRYISVGETLTSDIPERTDSGKIMWAYCIEHGASGGNGADRHTVSPDLDTAWNKLSEDARIGIETALICGFPSCTGLGGISSWGNLYAATQAVIWEFQTGKRQIDYDGSRMNGTTCADDGETANFDPDTKSAYDALEEKVNIYLTQPEWSENQVVLEFNTSTGNYEKTVTDKAGVIGNYTVQAVSGVAVSVSGSMVTLSTADRNIKDAVIGFEHTGFKTENLSDQPLIILEDGKGYEQRTITGAPVADCLSAALKVSVNNLQYRYAAYKTDMNGKPVSGVTFGIFSDSDCTEKVAEAVSDDKGVIRYPVTDGEFFASPQEFYAKELSVPAPYTVNGTPVRMLELVNTTEIPDLNFDGTGDSTVTNTDNGNLVVKKVTEDGKNLKGWKFQVEAVDEGGVSVSDFILTTDEKGIARKDDLPRFHMTSAKDGSVISYIITEIDSPEGVDWYLDVTKKASVKLLPPEGNTLLDTIVIWNNHLKKFTLTAVKKDTEKDAAAQGDGTLEGAVYGFYDGDTLLDTYTTGKDGRFTTKEYPCGDHYMIKEITPPAGYLLDETEHHVKGEGSEFTAEHNTILMTFTEKTVRAKIVFDKFVGKPGEAVIEPGAEFEVYLKSAGSYEKANEDERDYVITGEYGMAETKDLPYGVYVIHQVKGREGYKLAGDTEAFIRIDGKAERPSELLLNEPYEAYVVVHKTDAESGEVIPVAGAEFQILDAAMNAVEFKVYSGSGTKLTDTLSTDEEGKFVTPHALPFGTYYLKEVRAPEGYVLDPEPKRFLVTEESYSGEIDKIEYDTLIDAGFSDTAQKGIIKVYKQGPVFSSVFENEGVFTPIFETAGLSGAEYTVTAAEDIVTPDGTLRAKKGDLVAGFVTDENGYGQTGELYLGNYELTETKAPDGYIANAEPELVELTYGGQEKTVTEKTVTVTNERQSAEFRLLKVMAKDKDRGIGENGEILNVVFGLYAKEEITAADGNSIPKDGLLERISADLDGKVLVTKELPEGTYYFKEISTDPNYILDENEYEVGFAYDGEGIRKRSVSANDGRPVVNEIRPEEVVASADDLLRGAVAAVSSNIFSIVFTLTLLFDIVALLYLRKHCKR